MPFRVRLKCRTQAHNEMDANDLEHHTGSSIVSAESPNELIWYDLAFRFVKRDVFFTFAIFTEVFSTCHYMILARKLSDSFQGL